MRSSLRTAAALAVLVILNLTSTLRADPAQALGISLQYARTLPPDPKRQVRYLDLTHIPEQDLPHWYEVLSFHLNSLSREPDLVRPRQLANGTVLAFDLRDYGIDYLTFGKFATPQAAEPYFHVVADITTTDQYGKKSTVRDTLPAPWLPRPEIDELYRLTNSRTPIVRGDWFLYQTAVQIDRVAGYYDFLGLGKKEADFQKLIGANPAEAKRLRLETAASVAYSSVALHNRGISRQQALTGGYWATQDYKTSTNKQNTARLLAGDTEPPAGDASEQYGVLPNGLFAYWLQDGKGNRQDSAPDDIASDSTSTSSDRRVQTMLSCVRCHKPGLQGIDDYARKLFQAPLELKSPDYERLKRLRQLYLSDLPGRLVADNAVYASSVRAVNGLSTAENARQYADAWQQYADTVLMPDLAARELGTTEEKLIAAVKLYMAAVPIADPVVAAYAQTPPLPIIRPHFEEVYPLFQKILGRAP